MPPRNALGLFKFLRVVAIRVVRVAPLIRLWINEPPLRLTVQAVIDRADRHRQANRNRLTVLRRRVRHDERHHDGAALVILPNGETMRAVAAQHLLDLRARVGYRRARVGRLDERLAHAWALRLLSASFTTSSTSRWWCLHKGDPSAVTRSMSVLEHRQQWSFLRVGETNAFCASVLGFLVFIAPRPWPGRTRLGAWPPSTPTRPRCTCRASPTTWRSPRTRAPSCSRRSTRQARHAGIWRLALRLRSGPRPALPQRSGLPRPCLLPPCRRVGPAWPRGPSRTAWPTRWPARPARRSGPPTPPRPETSSCCSP